MDTITPQQLRDAALAWIFQSEGRSNHNDPDDPGGDTDYGISLRYLKSTGQRGDINGDGVVDELDIRSLTPEIATDFYLKDFWLPSRCSKLPPMIALAVFDGAVNTGVRTTARLLQHAARVKVDGIIGPKTLATIHRLDNKQLLKEFLGWRALYYRDIALANSSLSKYLRGWYNRLFNLQQYLLEELP